MKPDKIVYENQEKVYERVLDFARKKLKGVREAYLWGSLVEGKFSKYEEKYGSHEGSDIDVIVFSDDVFDNWKYLNTERSWWKLYSGGRVEVDGVAHRLDIMLVKDGREDVARNFIKKRGEGVVRIL